MCVGMNSENKCVCFCSVNGVELCFNNAVQTFVTFSTEIELAEPFHFLCFTTSDGVEIGIDTSSEVVVDQLIKV